MNAGLFLYEHPVFRYDEFAAWKVSQGTKQQHSVSTSLAYYVKAGRIIHLRRGLYAVVPPNLSPEDIAADPYLIAAKAAKDGVLAYHTALELHGLAYSSFQKLFETISCLLSKRI